MNTDTVRVLVAAPTPPGTLDALAQVSDRIQIVRPEQDLYFLDPTWHDMMARTLTATPVDVLFADRLPRAWEPDGRLKWVQLIAAGTDWERGKPVWQDPNIVITNASGIHAAAISEWVAAMLLTHSRSVQQVLDWKNQRRWTMADERPSSSMLLGKTLGLVGYGAIGREVARLARALGMRVIALDRITATSLPPGRYQPPRLAHRLPMSADEVELRHIDQLDQTLPECDYVVLAAALNTTSAELIGRAQLAAMKSSAFLINIARGGLIDEDALVEALTKRTIAGAAIDVFTHEPPPLDHPLFDLPTTLLSPHSSGGFDEYYDWAHELLRVNLARYLADEPLLNVIDRQLA
ncbi:MAG: D-2-hydroxyacid dehydrogenase [Propionibacteriaceae bacterium]|jgi:phosphoglycerate dehydrogenase-like enzyme|nr:D-2-hydroxyacid dehydrogenase [Propionibacteriaceae bacterium]